MKKQPPKNALKFLRWFCREDYIEEIEGDLVELFEKQFDESPRRANRSFIWQVILHFRPSFFKSIKTSNPLIHPDMLMHYAKITWRSLMKSILN